MGEKARAARAKTGSWRLENRFSPGPNSIPHDALFLANADSNSARNCAFNARPNSKIWIPDITGPPGVKTKLILDLGLVSEAPWSTLGGGTNKKIWFLGLEFYFCFLAWFSEDIVGEPYDQLFFRTFIDVVAVETIKNRQKFLLLLATNRKLPTKA